MEFYERFEVEEYYIYNPENGDLMGWRRRGDKLKKIGRMKGFVSRRLGVRFEPGKGEDNLTVIGRDGQPFISPLEMSRRLKAESRRVEEAERQRAAERDRADRYAARLRQLGIEPD